MVLHFFRIILLFVVCFSCPLTQADAPSAEIPDGLVWMNSASPLKIQDLRGKFVVVYFWSYSGVNVQSVVDQCRELQEKYPTQVVVIGIHAGKALSNDRLNDRVADALATYRISHPVAIDDQMQNLKGFRFDRYPSAVLIAPDGSVLFKKIGDDNLFYFFNKLILKNLPRFQEQLDLSVTDFQKLPSVDQTSEAPKEVAAVAADLPDKVLQPGLMGNIALETPKVPADISAPTEPSSPGYVNVPADLPAIEGEETAVNESPVKTLKIKNFLGQKTVMDREYSQKVGQVVFDLTLPIGGQLLGEDKSFVRVWSDEHTIVAQKYIRDLHTEVPVDREFSTKEMYIEVMLYYCTHGDKAICLIKSMLYTVPLAPYLKWENIQIHSNIPENGS